MFRFEHIDHFVLLIAIPVVLLIYFLARINFKRKLEVFGNSSTVSKLLSSISESKRWIKLACLCVGILFLTLAWTNPQWGYKQEKVKVKSTEIFIALDISLSMLAEDISPNRLERSKRFAQRLVRNLRGEKIGLILFAGSAYLQVPITADVTAVELFLKSASTTMAGTQGTNIAEALQFADESFSETSEYRKVAIVITDGENHEEDAINKATELEQRGIIVHAIGVGTSEGDFIPVDYGGRVEYKKDRQNQNVRTSLNIDMLKDLAKAGGGNSYLISNEDAVIESIKTEIDRMEKIESEEQSFTDYNSYFQYFLFFGLLCFFAEFILTDVKSSK